MGVHCLERIYFLIFLAELRGTEDLSSATRDGTRALCSGSSDSYPLDHQGSLWGEFLKNNKTYHYAPAILKYVTSKMSFFCSRIQSLIPRCVELSCFLIIFQYVTESQSLLISQDIDTFEEYCSSFFCFLVFLVTYKSYYSFIIKNYSRIKHN